jgi:hypothetical protein
MTYRTVTNFNRDVADRFNPGGSAFGPSKPMHANESAPSPGGVPRSGPPGPKAPGIPECTPMPADVSFERHIRSVMRPYPALPNDSTR